MQPQSSCEPPCRGFLEPPVGWTLCLLLQGTLCLLLRAAAGSACGFRGRPPDMLGNSPQTAVRKGSCRGVRSAWTQPRTHGPVPSSWIK